MTPAVVSVWCIPLRCPASTEQRLLALLDPDEIARAARFATSSLRGRYVVSRGALRLILARCTARGPAAIQFITAARGKPTIAGGPHFSLSRSDNVALVAVSDDGPLGVDVERVRADVEISAFARHLINDPDVAQIEALPAKQRLRAWYQAWARLEAVAKASGNGLREDEAIADRETSPFRAWNLSIDNAHVGAVATEAPAAHIVYESLSEVPLA